MATRRQRSALAMSGKPGIRSALPGQPRRLAFAVGAALLPWSFIQPAHADVASNTLPTGGQYAYGSGSITQPGSNALQVIQTTDKGTINWGTFSIGSAASVNFTQPSASSLTVNRVLGSNPSEIFGRLSANGQIFLSNPNGVLFAPGASVDVGALFATTLTLSDQDAMAGRYNSWSNPGKSGTVVNQGRITIITANGYAALAAPQVRNDGVIVAHAGNVTLAAGNRVSLDMIGDGLIKVDVEEAALNASAINSGTIQADGGSVLLTARSANALLDTVVNNTGIIRANSLVARNGEIILDGGSAGGVANSGTLDASGATAGTSGGTVKVLGQYVRLFDGTKIDASGDAGGGTVLVGGNFHGAGPEQNASTTSVDANTRINADALTTGSGGGIIVWSNDHTTVAGSISAIGSRYSGGGFVELSGHRLSIASSARVTTGQGGTLLLDPTDYVINDVGGDTNGATLSALVQGNATTDVVATGNIQVNDAVNPVTWSNANILNLKAGTGGPGAGTVTFGGGSIAMTGGGTLNVYYSPASYATLTDFSANANITGGTTNSYAWLFINDSSATANSKTYDGFTTATLVGSFTFDNAGGAVTLPDGISGGQQVSLASGSADFNSAHVASANTVNFTGYSLGGADAGRYALFAQPASQSQTINPAPVSFTGTKAYDSTTTFNASAFGTAANIATGINAEDLILTGAGSVASAHVAAGSQAVTLGTLALTNGTTGIASDYTFVGGTQTASVTPAPVSFTGTKVYDSTTTFNAAAFGTSGNIATGINGEDLNLTGAGSVASAHVAAGSQAVTLGTLALANGVTGVASDYTFVGGTQTASVTPASVSFTGTRAYDGTTSLAASTFGSGGTINTGVGGETLLLTGSGSVASSHVAAGSQAVNTVGLTLNDGTGTAADYTFTAGTQTAAVTAASVSFTGNRAYDGTTSFAASTFGAGGTINTGVAGETLVLAGSGSVGSSHVAVGSQTVNTAGLTLTDGTGSASDYTFVGGTQSAIVTAASLSFTGTRAYDGTTSFAASTFGSSGTINTGIGGETLVLSGSGSVVSSHVAAGSQTVNTAGLTLTNGTGTASDYIFLGGTQTATVTAASVSFTGTKVYDSTATFNANAFGTGGNIATGINGEDLNLTGSGSVASAHVAAGSQAVTLGTLALTNGATGVASDYTVVGGTQTASVTPASVSFTGARAYDGTTTFAASTFGLSGTINTGVGGETLALTGSGSVASSHVAAGSQAVNSVGLTLTNGSGAASDYTFAGGTQNATVTAASVTLGGTRAYDGGVNFGPAAFGSFNTGVAGETLTVTGNGTVASKDVAAGVQVLNTTGLTLANGSGLASDYVIASSGNTGSITQLGAVSWVGPATGSWSVAANWAGGAIPDKNNVANVDLNGATVTFDNGVATLAGSVQVSNVSNGNLTVNSNNLNVASSVALASYSQTGGAVATGATFTATQAFNQTGGTLTATDVSITQTVGSIAAKNIVGSNTVTLTANTATGDIQLGAGGALSGTTVTLTAGRDISLASSVTGTTVGINFGQQASGTFSTSAAISGTTTATGGANTDTFDFTAAPPITATLAGGGGSDTLKQAGGKSWNLDNAIANSGTSGGLTWSSIENLTDTANGAFNMGTGGSLSGSVTASAGSVTYASYATGVTFRLNGAASTGLGGWSGITSVIGSANNDTVVGTGQTYAITGPNAGNNGIVTWTSFENLTDTAAGTLEAGNATWTLNGSNTGTVTNLGGTFSGMANLTDLGAGAFNMHGTGDGSISGNLVSTNPGSISYAGYTTPVTLQLSGAGNQSTGITGTWSGITTATASSNSDTIKGAGQTYTITGSNAGTNGTVSWTSFENITDTAAGTVREANATWTITGSSAGTVTNLSGTFSGIANLQDTGTGTLKEANATWTITGANAGTVTNLSGSFSGMGNLQDTANTGTLEATNATWTLNASNTGTMSNLSGSFTGMANLADLGAGAFNMHGTGNGSITGNLVSTNPGSISYAGYTTPVTLQLSGAANQSTGITGTWSGITSATGSSNSDTINGTAQTYTITGSNAGNNGTVTWTSFETLTDVSGGTLRATSATWTLNGTNTGTVSNLGGTFAGMANLTDLGTGTFNMHGTGDGSISGTLNGGTNGAMNYAGYGVAVTVSLSGAAGTTTGVAGTRTGITSFSGSGGSDTITGSGATYDLTSQNGGNSGGLSWSGFENVSDATGGLFNLFVASNNVTGKISSGGAGPATCVIPNSAACANLNSNVDITALNVSIGGTLFMTGSAGSWNLTGAPQPATFGASNANANVFFNGACVGGPACGTVITITGSIGATVSQVATQALQEALDTDSVQKQIDYGFAGDVGTTPPMDHRIDDTGISTPQCFEQSREGEACGN